jgi:glutamate/tyrosine decarboxylase-like PLP-dependent enzyme
MSRGGSLLSLDPETMRALGYRTVDMLVERLTADPGPVVSAASPAELAALVAAPPAETPRAYEEVLERLERDVLPHVARLGHPGYLAFIPGEGTWPGALGDLIASALNLDTCWWLGSSGPSALELAVLDWFRDWVGYPAEAAGVLVSGGSAANLTALACAREDRVGAADPDALVYLSDQSHSSMARAVRLLGFRPDQVRVLPTDADARIRVEALRALIRSDRASGRTPFLVGANAGATTSGAVDPLPELARLCRDEGLWLHVDGAYGAFAALTDRGAKTLAGLELADSITLDPHKWLYQPIEVGAVLVRDGAALRQAFAIAPDYMQDMQVGGAEVNFSDLGMQLTRTARAVKLWLSLHTFGLAAFRDAIDRCLDLAVHAQTQIEAAPELELMSPASLGIVTFRRHPPGIDDERALERLNAELAAAIERSGEVFVSSGLVRGRYVLRLCILNHSTSQVEVDRALDLASSTPVAELEGDASPAPNYAGLDAPWLDRPELDAAGLRSIPLFSTLDDRAIEETLRRARERSAADGEPIIEQWQLSRELYVILSGAVAVRVDGIGVATLGAGDFFGELSSLDWGAGFGRIRTADVLATSPCRLLELGWDLVARLTRDHPELRAVLEATGRRRLGTTGV